jgi:asparagine synthase (glutamine-hydrolysing)
MEDPGTGNVIVFNGEIYNHRTLRLELGAPREGWRGSSDTETLLAAYRRWGIAMLGRLRGMFALAIHDAADGSLWLARDRLGIKPLYLRAEPEGIRFASETRVLQEAGKCRPNARALAAYLRWGACPDDQLLDGGMEALPAGHWLHVSPDGGRRQEAYWQPATGRRLEGDPVKRVRALVERAVEEHLLSDVPVASFLSGGIDSSVVTALAAQRLGRGLRTFSVGFRERGFDETAVAAEVARRYHTDHERIELDEAETQLFVREAVDRMDLPSVDAINTYIVARAVARRGVKVALSGLGGDELFGGYPSFRDAGRLATLARLPQKMRSALSWLGPAGRRLADLPRADVATLAAWRRCFWTAADLRSAGLPADRLEVEVPDGLPDNFARISWVELSRYMRWMLLRDSDQMSMAVSLELRVPLLDHEFVDYVLSLPSRAKTPGPCPKGLLVQACLDLLPRAVFNRAKQGFALPMDAWMRGPLKDFVAQGLAAMRSLNVLPTACLAQLESRFESESMHWTRLWSVVVLGHHLMRESDTSGDRRATTAPQPARG